MIGRRHVVAGIVAILAVSACGGSGADDQTLRLYSSVTQDTVDVVVAGFEAANPGSSIEVFRAPTGELAARIAAERRDSGMQADVLWLTDPLSIEQYGRDGLLRSWSPSNIDAVPSQYRTDQFFGTRLLNMVIVTGDGVVAADWPDLADVEGGVVLPDPGFAGSAYGALAYFALDPAYGMGFYSSLSDAGGVQVQTPGDVVVAVAEGTYGAGITLDRTARDAVDDGSPVQLVWPLSGAVAIYSPIAVVDDSPSALAEAFVDYVLSAEAQVAIAETGWEPIRSDVEWPDRGAQSIVDWPAAFDRQVELLDAYRAVFGG